MRNLLSALLTAILCASCSPVLIPETTIDIDTAWKSTSNFRGIPDPPGGYWKSPAEFVADGGGDCEDFSTYLLYLLGPDSGAKMVIIKIPGYRVFHAAIMLADDTIIEPQVYGMTWDAAPLWTLSYDTVMRLAGNGKRSLDNGDEWVDNGLSREMIAECE